MIACSGSLNRVSSLPQDGSLRRSLSNFSRVARALFAVQLLLGLYAFLVEPSWIQVTHHAVEASVSRPMVVAHITDLHSAQIGYRETKVLSLIRKEKPDLIVVTGDSVASDLRGPGPEAVGQFLAQLRAPLGVAWRTRTSWRSQDTPTAAR